MDKELIFLNQRIYPNASDTFRNEFIEIIAGIISEENDFIRMI